MLVTKGASSTRTGGKISAFTGTHTLGVPDDLTQVYAVIADSATQTQQMLYSVPSNFNAVISNAVLSSGGTKTTTFQIFIRPFEGMWNEKPKYDVTSAQMSIEHIIIANIEAKSDIAWYAKVNIASAPVSASFGVLMNG